MIENSGRRTFLAGGLGLAVAGTASRVSAQTARATVGVPRFRAMSRTARDVLDKADFGSVTGLKHIYGFNYQPSWGHDAPSIWLERFNPVRFRQELEAGKRFFPRMNTVRIWLGYGAWKRNSQLLLRNFHDAIDICTDLELLVMPVLFTIWRGEPLFDPISIQGLLRDPNHEANFGPFLEQVVAPHRGNPSILAWDICNEPWGRAVLQTAELIDAQEGWLRFVHARVKSLDPSARTCCGSMFDFGYGDVAEPFSDIVTPHIYGYPMWKESRDKGSTELAFRDWLAAAVDFYMSQRRNAPKKRPILSTETVWGAPDDSVRTGILRDTLSVLKANGVGFLPHALMTSGVADLHLLKPGAPNEWGDLPPPNSMAFLNADLTLRAGHGAFNDYAQ